MVYFPDAFSKYATFAILAVGIIASCSIVAFSRVDHYDTAAMYVPAAARVAHALDMARKSIVISYNSDRAYAYYREALALDPTNEEALYELARIALVKGSYAEGRMYAARFAATYPNKPRILYVDGLLAGYSKNPAEAEARFRQYILEEKLSSWQSRLDLSWALFAQGKYVDMNVVLSDQLALHPDNPWLLNNTGAALLGVGRAQDARIMFARAQNESANITDDEWRSNYSFNNPDETKRMRAVFDSIIAYNMQRARGHDVPVPEGYEKIAVHSPDATSALAVSACGESCGPHLCTSPANACGHTRQVVINTCLNPGWSCAGVAPPFMPQGYGQTCTAANVCGVTGSGTIGCSGQCEATAGLPSNFGKGCTVQTSCGAVPGRINCNGQCNVSRYNTCPGVVIIGDESGEEYDEFGNPVPKFGCAAAKVKIKALPLLVRKGKVSALQWVANEAVACTVTGGGQSWTGLQGVEITNPIQETTRYTVTCQPMAQCTGQNALPFSASVEVKVVPDWQEI